MYGGIEAGGTKFVCAVGTGPDDLSEMVRFPTTTPAETIRKAIDYFKSRDQRLAGIGIASFGPIDPNPASSTYGYITSTPKPGWQQTDLVGAVKRAMGVPVGFDTDVNGAALSETRWGAAQDVESSVYFTVGTGIGGGAIVNGKTVQGLIHPEMGHMMLPRAKGDDYKGYCPFHGPCLEGMATGPALKDRWGVPAETLPSDHPAWEYEAHYLAMAVINTMLVLSPERVILGGGVMHQEHLFPMIRKRVQETLNGYVDSPVIAEHIDSYIVPPGLGDRAGVLGAILLAEQAMHKE